MPTRRKVIENLVSAPLGLQLARVAGGAGLGQLIVGEALAAAADVTAPGVPGNLRLVDKVLTWNPSIDPVVAGQETSGLVNYTVYRDGSPFETVEANAPLAQQLRGASIGTTVSGSESQAGTTWTVSSQSTGLGGSSGTGVEDGLRFVSTPVAGDVTIVARVAQHDMVSSKWSKVGLMMRGSLDANAQSACMLVFPTQTANGINLEYRTAVGVAGTQAARLAGITAPIWFKLSLSRAHNTVIASYSSDGARWTEHAAVAMTLPSMVHVGLAVTSNNGTSVTGRFEQVRLLAPVAAPALALLQSGAYSVAALDAAGNQSAQSPRVTYTHVPSDFPTSRNALQWPFAANSIWNMPIGSGARYVHARFNPAVSMASGYREEENILVLTANAPLTPFYHNPGGFDPEDNRCTIWRGEDGKAAPTRFLDIPVPTNFVYDRNSRAGDTKVNGCAAVLLRDGKTLVHPYTFTRCTAGAHAAARNGRGITDTWKYSLGRDIFGPGITGSHGGSNMSALGGCLRIGELRPGSGRVRHALQLVMRQDEQYRPVAGEPEGSHWRWPAANGDDWVKKYFGTNRAVKPGSLYALPPSVDIERIGLETQPAKEIAWTLQNYGGYMVDTTPAATFAFGIEFGPAGDFAEQFDNDWGFPLKQTSYTESGMARLRDHAWVRDLDRIVSRLHVVDNNAEATIGGGGTPRQPLAPPFA